ncbi:MAG: hypothetical protein Q9182_001891 [Xanthomendoza sp. 2 TL-2023]
MLQRVTRGGTSHAYYVPLFFLAQPIVFWIAVALLHKANAEGMASLVKFGWLFKINTSVERQTSIGTSWDYWHLFNFTKVEPRAFKDATTNIILVVVIGILNLPVYVPALSLSLKTKVNANHEFIGQGVANILAGTAGAPPNILQLSYSTFFARAGGGRLEAGIVTALMMVFFFIASKILPYVPTVLASTLVLFLGIELALEAIWESAKTSTVAEWLVMMTTLIACTFLGFAPGFGVGIGAAILLYAITGALDTLREIQPKAWALGALDDPSFASVRVVALTGHVYTSAVDCLEGKLRERTKGETIVFAGIMQRSPVTMDLQRGGVLLDFTACDSRSSHIESSTLASMAFEDYNDATQDILHRLIPSVGDPATNGHCEQPAALSQFQSRGGIVGHYQPGALVNIEGKPIMEACSGDTLTEDLDPRFIFVLQGQICVEEENSSTREQIPRLSMLNLCQVYGRAALAWLKFRSATNFMDFAPTMPSPCNVEAGQSVTVVTGLEVNGMTTRKTLSLTHFRLRQSPSRSSTHPKHRNNMHPVALLSSMLLLTPIISAVALPNLDRRGLCFANAYGGVKDCNCNCHDFMPGQYYPWLRQASGEMWCKPVYGNPGPEYGPVGFGCDANAFGAEHRPVKCLSAESCK